MSSSTGPHRWTDGELLWPAEAQGILKLSRATIYRLIASGVLPSVRVGRSVRIVRSGLESYLDGRLMDRTTPTAAPQTTDPDAILRQVEENDLH